MLFEGSEAGARGTVRARSGRRRSDGVVRSDSDFWVVVAPEQEQPTEWLYREEVLEITPLRVCHAVQGERLLLVAEQDSEYDEWFSDLLGVL